MERVRIDAALVERLPTLTQPVELVNDEGFVVALLEPRCDLPIIVMEPPGTQPAEPALKPARGMPEG